MSDRSAFTVFGPRTSLQTDRDERMPSRDGRKVADVPTEFFVGFDFVSLAQGWMLATAIAMVAAIFNVLTLQADMPDMPRWEAWALEGSSNAMLALLAWLPGLAILSSAPFRSRESSSRWALFIATHLAVAALFSVLHVGGMVALRLGFYAAAKAAYQYGPIEGRFLYEFRKDLFAYAIFASVFLMLHQSRQTRHTTERATSFDIHDGAHLIRAPVRDILAASSAGNYVEFVLADGRRPLMRATLAAIEKELGSLGFVRIHRSWLINPERVTSLRRRRTGDWTVDLDTCSAPLSRRYRSALVGLKGSGHPAA